MSNNDSGPINPGQAPTMAKSDNTAVKIVLIVVFVIFGLPIILVIAAMIFLGANMDKFLGWIDEHEGFYTDYYEVDTSRSVSASTIHTLSQNERVRKASNLAKVDCENMKLLAESIGSPFISESFCESESIRIGSSIGDSMTHVYLADDDYCAEYDFLDNFTKISSYSKKAASTCKDLKTVKLVDTGETAEPIKEQFKKHHENSIEIEEDEDSGSRKFVLRKG